MFWIVVVLISCVKLILIPTYHSTDFEVHRNWLAITHSLPIKNWYFESTSEWTLDYPPLFAWFEFCLSQFAYLFDPAMLRIENVNYASPATVLFQRLSVIITDLVLAYSTRECCTYLSHGIRKSSKWNSWWGSPSTTLQFILLGNAGLLLVDHIHFQYNGFLFGLLVLSMVRILQERHLSGAFWFAVLLNFKHIFIYVAPVYFVYLLRNYCFMNSHIKGLPDWRSFSSRRLIKLGAVVASVFLVSFGPFLSKEQLLQVLSRLFPFKRGLCHAYWAPNFWVLYNTVDKLSAIIAPKLGFDMNITTASMTGGLVQEFKHAVLPEITPKITFVCTLLTILPAIFKLWHYPGNPFHFVRSIVLCAGGAFMFGWHVHEKAILMVIVPLSLLAVVWKKEAQIYLLLATVGHYSLFPLLFTPFEMPIKVLIFLVHSVYAFGNLSHLFDSKRGKFTFPLLNVVESIYLSGLIPLFIFHEILFPLLSYSTKLPFLPLMLTSVYCTIGITYAWVKYYWYFMTISETKYKKKAH